MIEPVDILAFSPHPDDAELGCGGSLFLSARKGLRVDIVDLSEGECSSRGTSAQRKEEKLKATELLGLSDRFSLRLPDTKIGLEPSHLTTVIEIIRKTRPRSVLAPYWKDRHPDHENAGQLIREACFYAGVASTGRGRPHRPESMYYYMVHSPFEPSFVMDITPVWEQKCEILRAYRTQFFNEDPGMNPTAISNPEFLRYHEARCVYFGAMIGAAYGEPFFCSGPLPVRGLPGLEYPRPDKGGLSLYKSI
jgi:bacillithiol biosynthesis deacetylase BshB1